MPNFFCIVLFQDEELTTITDDDQKLVLLLLCYYAAIFDFGVNEYQNNNYFSMTIEQLNLIPQFARLSP